MGMLIASILLLIFAGLFFINAAKNAANLIFTTAIVIASIGTFGSYMEFHILPYLRNQMHPNDFTIAFCDYLCSFMVSLGHFVPYANLLAFTLYFSGYMEGQKTFQHVIYNLIIYAPVMACFTLFPVQRQFNPDFKFISAWSGLYFLISSIIQIKSYFRASTKKEKNDRLFVIAAIIPTVLAHFLMVLLAQALGNKTIWRYGYLIVAGICFAYVVFIIKFGVFGLRIRFEKMKMDTAIKTISSSTLIFNHAVKNEVAKISMCKDLINRLQAKLDDNEVKEKIHLYTEIIDSSLSHLLNLAERIKDNSQPIVLYEDTFSLKELVDNTLKPFINAADSNINIRSAMDYDIQIIADYNHLKECLGNIIKNAEEALKGQGNITVSAINKNRFIALRVEDDGPGIEQEHLPCLFDPFFSTKKGGTNYGLGLFYCYNVMKKHGGFIEVNSKAGVGTGVSLILPAKRVLTQFKNMDNRSAGVV